jgi:hypothetical protein
MPRGGPGGARHGCRSAGGVVGWTDLTARGSRFATAARRDFLRGILHPVLAEPAPGLADTARGAARLARAGRGGAEL